MRRILLSAALLGVVVMGGLVAVDIARNSTGGQSQLCRSLESRVVGLESFRWDNGITESAGSWGQVLTDGVAHAADADRIVIAEAVANDRSGYRAFLDALPSSAIPAAQRLHALALDPSAERVLAASVDDDVSELLRLGRDECGFA